MISHHSLRAILPLAAAVLCGAAFFQKSEASQPAFRAVAALPASLTLPASAGFLAMPVAPPSAPLGIPGTSVMPPLPGPGEQCSVDGPGTCSVTAPSQRCSARNNNGNQCSTFGSDTATCSAMGPNSICSVLPPTTSGGNPSECSTFSQTFLHQCSALGTGNNMRCSTKAQGFSVCSTHLAFPTNGDQRCSVINIGATANSYCSTKLNVALPAKGCSTFVSNSQCSVISGGKGRCTTFGAADPGSCSILAPGGLCSIMPSGPVGNPCIQ